MDLIFHSGSFADASLIAMLLANLMLLATSRLSTAIGITAMQGAILSLLTLILHPGHVNARLVLLAAGSAALKAGLFPWLLLRAVKLANIKKEIEPIIGYSISLFIGMLILALSLSLASRLPLPGRSSPPFVLTVSFFAIFTGCFLTVARSKAIMQVIGYLVLENGIYLFGIPFVTGAHFLIELGVILDLTVAVLVMGIIIHNINREFHSLDVRKLADLKDWDA